MSNIRDDPDGQYICVHFNKGLTYNNKIGDLLGYSNPVWYNQKGIYNILSLGLVQKHYLVTYNIQYGNEFVVHIPKRPTFKTTKDGILFHNMRHRIKKNNTHIMVNGSRSPTPQVEENKKQYTARHVNRDDYTRKFLNITDQPLRKILHVVDNNILQNIPIL